MIQVPFKVVCINDKIRPDGIPTSKWIKEGDIYTVIQVSILHVQDGAIGFKLEEKNIDDCLPYQFFNAARFLPLDLEKRIWAEETLERILEEAKKEEQDSQILKQ